MASVISELATVADSIRTTNQAEVGLQAFYYFELSGIHGSVNYR